MTDHGVLRTDTGRGDAAARDRDRAARSTDAEPASVVVPSEPLVARTRVHNYWIETRLSDGRVTITEVQ